MTQMDTNPALHARWIEVTPAMATTWLQQNNNVRNINERRVAQFAKDMTEGNWDNNGETIKFDKHGVLVDGQHRLTALIRAGKPIPMMIVTGVESRDNIDIGQPRSVGQVVQSHYDIKEGAIAVAALRILRLIRDRHISAMYEKITPTTAKAMFDNIDRELWGVACELSGGLKQRGIFRACFYHMLTIDREFAIRFATDYREGANLAVDDPVYRLREMFRDTRLNLSRTGRLSQVACIIKAWNARRQGRRVKILAYKRNEEFPTAI